MASLRQQVFWIAVAVAACGFTTGAYAQELCTDFENYNAAPNGLVLTGQQGWTMPAGSNDYQVFTYFTGNPYGIPDNVEGGLKFIAGRSAGTTFARAEHLVGWTNVFWEVNFDLCANYNGSGTATNNVGSQSTPLVPQDWITLFSYPLGQEGVLCQIGYLVYDAAGVQAAQPGLFPPGGQWENLPLRNWFRLTMVVDFPGNKITEVSIRDITAGGPTTTYNPTDWYLEGGAAGSTSTQTQIRFFAGGTNPGNILAVDNLCARPRGTVPVEPGTWGSIKARFEASEGGSHRAMPVAADPEVQ